jgi:hypothetical protein
LKKSGIGDDILKEITEKEDEILSVGREYYSEISKDTAEIKRLSELLKEKVEAMEEQISEKTAELLDRVSGFDLPRAYRIERELDGVRDALYIHPTIIEGYIERPETEGLTTHQNIRILWTPGIGKTTAIYTIIERSNPELVVIISDAFTETDVNRLLREDLDDNFLLVWDDFHVRPTLFMDTIYKLRNKFDNFYTLCAARSTEIEKIIESLKRKIWLKEAENTYSSFDIQLEAVEIGNEWFKDFETFVRSNELEQKYQSHLLFNLSY